MRVFYPKTQIIAAGHDFRYWDMHGVTLAVMNSRRPGTPAYENYGWRLQGPVYLDSENIHWSYVDRVESEVHQRRLEKWQAEELGQK